MFSDILAQFSGIVDVFSQIWFVVAHGGWVLLVIIVLYMLFYLYVDEIQTQFVLSQEWSFLNIRVPKTNELSTLAVEQIFTQMHALSTTVTFAQKYVEGKVQLWYTLELVSLGGKVSYIIRTPKSSQELVEASFYAQYPNAEISVVEDYMSNLPDEVEESDVDIFGFEFKMTDPFTLPIKTYREFEHPTAEAKIVDPLKPLFEALATMQPHEMYAIQILIKPVAEDDIKPLFEAKAKELIEGKKPAHHGFNLLSFIFGIFTGGDSHAAPAEKKERNFSLLSDMEKEKVNGVLRKISKPAYYTKIRHLYLAPKDRMDGGRKALPIGAYRTLGTANLNRLKPDTKFTWTKLEYKVSQELEQPYIDAVVKHRKHVFYKAFRSRGMFAGLSPFVLNVEELATIYHLPLVAEDTASGPSIESVQSKKSQPPANLPVGEY